MNVKKRLPISVVINTLNEEHNLPYALRSVQGWADEIVVVDMYSDDGTVEVAAQYGASVYFHERVMAFDSARKFAVSKATHNWILVLDADELIPTELKRVLSEILLRAKADIVRIPRLNYLLGKPIMHTGWGPNQDKQNRFFKKEMMEFNDQIHAFMRPSEGANLLELPYVEGQAIVHFNYVNTAHFIEKLNKYTSVEAMQALERGESPSLGKLFFYSIKEFLERYIMNQGFLDGWRGFYLSVLMAGYRMITLMKIKELLEMGTEEKIRAIYRMEAETQLGSESSFHEDD